MKMSVKQDGILWVESIFGNPAHSTVPAETANMYQNENRSTHLCKQSALVKRM
jgi:hypothetical protein